MTWLISALGLGGLGLAMVFIPGVKSFVFGAIRFVFEIVSKYPWQAALIASLCLSGWLWQGKRAAQERERVALVQVQIEIDAHRATKAGYVAAQQAAKFAEDQRVARVAQTQERITNETSADYRRRLASLRADYDRLRQFTRTSGSGLGSSPHREPMPGVPASPGRIDAATREDDILAERLECSIYVTQLDALIGDIEKRVEAFNAGIAAPAFGDQTGITP